MYKTISLGCSAKAWGSRLVWNISQEDIQVVLEHLYISMLTVPKLSWQDVKELGSFNCQ